VLAFIRFAAKPTPKGVGFAANRIKTAVFDDGNVFSEAGSRLFQSNFGVPA
jgi:hypothetical protein